MKQLFVTLTLILVGVCIYAQINLDITWQNCYGGSNFDEDGNIVETDFGYFLLSETRSDDGQITRYWGEGDIWLAAVDSIGNFLWGRCYGGTSVEISGNIIKDNFGFYYFSGWTFSNDGDVQSGNHGNYDRWIVKIDINGRIIWEKCYGGTGRDYGPTLKMLSNGQIIAYSATTSSDGDVPVNYGYLDVWITIIDPKNGDILTNKVFGNIGQNNIFDIVETKDKGFFFTSEAQEVEGMVQGTFHGNCDVWAVKLDSNFNIEWQKLYGGSSIDYQGWSILELEDGFIFLAQTISDNGDVSGFHGIAGDEGTYDIWVVRIDTTGNIIWEKCLGGSNYDYGRKLIQSDDGGFVLFAETDSHDGDVHDLHYLTYPWPIISYDDIWMVKLSAEGEIEWSRCFGGNYAEFISFDAIVKKAENNYVIVGSSSGSSPGDTTGDVNCSIHGLRDLWLFEIKDCDNYMPSIPTIPIGPDTLCTTTDSTATYSIIPAQGAWSYEWKVVPEEASSITGDSTSATQHWNSGWEGQAQISARSWNDCGQSDWSEVKNTWAYSCLGIHSPSLVPRTPHLQIFPNPVSTHIHCNIQNLNNLPQGSIEIYNYLGVKLDEIQVQGNQTSIKIDISSYPPGVYVAVLKNEQEVIDRKRFVKE